MGTKVVYQALAKAPPGLSRVLIPLLKSMSSKRRIAQHEVTYSHFNNLSTGNKKRWILARVRKIVAFAERSNLFYQDYYKSLGYNSKDLNSYDDLKDIPIVTKSMIKEQHSKWMKPVKGYNTSNTGGTSGHPLKFLVSSVQGIRERYYMSKIWEQIGISPRDYRAVFRGINLEGKPWMYKPEYDAFFINAYSSFEHVYRDYIKLFNKYNFSVLHGYPSSIYLFASLCLQDRYSALRTAINKNLKGILLGSEYPAPTYRSVIEKAFPFPSISWYGHSEMVILAREKEEPFLYFPFHSYGFTEAIKTASGETHLVGTCYDNYATPFIKYDTEDSITPVETKEGLLQSFQIDNGRVGEYVLNRRGEKVSLTALIFGRHHKAFEIADFVQISQKEAGCATIHLTTNQQFPEDQKMLDLFDFSDTNMSFSVCIREKPIVTTSGKVPLLISSAQGDHA